MQPIRRSERGEWRISMRKTIPRIWVVALLLLPVRQLLMAETSNAECTFPVGLGDEISKNYPEASLVTLADLDQHNRKLFQKGHGAQCPGLVKVDFYGDGKPTWAFVLVSGESPNRKAKLVVAQQLGAAWETRLLESTDGTPVVWREAPGKYQGVDGKKIRATKQVIVFSGLESWTVVYAWTGKDVEQVQLSD